MCGPGLARGHNLAHVVETLDPSTRRHTYPTVDTKTSRSRIYSVGPAPCLSSTCYVRPALPHRLATMTDRGAPDTWKAKA